MRKFVSPILPVGLVATLLYASVAGGQADKGKAGETEEKERVYHKVLAPTIIDQQADEFRNRYVQVPDYFGTTLSENEFRRKVERSVRRSLQRAIPVPQGREGAREEQRLPEATGPASVVSHCARPMMREISRVSCQLSVASCQLRGFPFSPCDVPERAAARPRPFGSP